MLRLFPKISAKATLLLAVVLVSCSEDEPATQLSPTITSYSPTSALTGTQIVINGTNFGTSADDVMVTFFEDEEAVVTGVTKTSITVTVPENAYVGSISVKVKDLEVTGGEFTVMTLCFVGGDFGVVPCPRQKGGAK